MWWHILGLNPTDDEKTVKRAYAKLIKTIDQDSEIEKFTKIHSAYRMAMQSFKKESFGKSNLLMYEGDAHWYLQELINIYNNFEKRLDVMSWRNLFACMSFKEEEEFKLTYIDFFNQYYKLSPAIWQVIDQHYPIANNKSFLWRDLTNGNFRFDPCETEQLTTEQVIVHLEMKIELFYLILGNDYSKALEILNNLSPEMFSADLYRWYFILTIADGQEHKIVTMFNQLRQIPEYRNMSLYYYAGFLTQKGEYVQSNELLKQVVTNPTDIKVDHILKENTFFLDKVSFDGMSELPWIESQSINKKCQKYLEKGDYKKALELNSNIKRKGIFGGGR